MQADFLRLSRRLPLALLASTVVGLAGAGVASAATYTVNTTNDSATPCTGSGTCSLRGAVMAADSAGGSSTIHVPAGQYKLTIPSAGSNDPATGDLDINNNANVTVVGAGSDSTTLSGNNVDRLFAVQQGASLTLSGMTLRQGLPSPNSTGFEDGGAVYSDGGLTIPGDVVFQDNQAPGDYNNNGQTGGLGGAIYADTNSAVTLTDATFENDNAGNVANPSAPSGGGAIADESNQALTIRKSSFAGNGTTDTEGGAIFSELAGGALNIDSSTFSGNSAGNGGGIFWDTNAAVTITHTTFAGNNTNGVGGAFSDEYSTQSTLDYDSFTNNSASGTCLIFFPFLTAADIRAGRAAPRQPGPYEYCFGGGGALALSSSSTSTSPSYTVDHDLFRGNNSSAVNGGAIAWGEGTLESNDSTYLDNNAGTNPGQASGGSSNTPGGGAIYADSSSTANSLTLINDTLSHNGGSDIAGGAILADTTTPASLINDTITDNVAYPAGGGGIYGTSDFTTTGYSGTGTAGIENTVIADNNGGDCYPQFTSFDLGHNMDSDGTCFSTSTQSSDLPNTEPGLKNPADNGGPLVGNQTDGSAVVIPTDAETSASRTVNAGTNTNCPSTDERGVARPQGGICDIGAFELAAAKLKVSKTAPKSVSLHSVFTYKIKVSNSGPGYSTSTTLVDRIPSSESFKGVIAPHGATCSHSGRTVTCKLGDLRKGGSSTVKIIVKANRTGKVRNTARATNAQGSKASGRATTKVHAVKAARAKRTAPKFTG